MGIIQANDQNTWPARLRETLGQFSHQIAAYQSERRRMGRLGNPYALIWETVLSEAKQSLIGECLLGYHATRLTRDEVEDVKRSGLGALSAELVDRRLSKFEACASVVARLRADNQANNPIRLGRLYFFFTRRSLSNESGVRRLLDSWGGEALYCGHENNPVIGPVLKSIGIPCIVLAAIPVKHIYTYRDVGEHLVNIWCDWQGIQTGHDPEFDGHTRRDVPSANIVRIVKFTDPAFKELTDHQAWHQPLL